MSIEVWGMVCAAAAALLAGLFLSRKRFGVATNADKLLVLGPVFEAVALAMFAAEHFTAPHELMPLVPSWLPWHLFWVYFFGAALLAAAISFILWRCVRWSSTLLAGFFFLVVATLDFPGIPAGPHDRYFWILTVRETCFGAGTLVLAGNAWAQTNAAGRLLQQAGRIAVGGVMIFYALEHFLHPHHVPGVPLQKMIPAWVPAPAALAYCIGFVLLAGGVGLLVPRAARLAAAGSGLVLVMLTVFFYVPIFLAEIHSPLAVEGLNYVGDTLLFAATVLLAGFHADLADFRVLGRAAPTPRKMDVPA